jgi:hypothetical protein
MNLRTRLERLERLRDARKPTGIQAMQAYMDYLEQTNPELLRQIRQEAENELEQWRRESRLSTSGHNAQARSLIPCPTGSSRSSTSKHSGL